MRKLLLSFVLLLTSWFAGLAGTLNSWTNTNFQGVWEITPTNPDSELGWLVKNIAGTTIGDAPITKLELALDQNGWGYITFYSGEVAGQFDVRGRIFTPGLDEYKPDYLSLLCANDYTNLTYGLINFSVGAYNGNASDNDAFSIYPPYGSFSAKAIRTSSIYVPGGISEIVAPSLLMQFNPDGISIVDADGENVMVYDMDGVLIYQTQRYAGENIKLHKGNCYIVKVNDNSMKILF
ncbi:MAG: hypothetical protein HDR88_10355 [Bacteroides sp.]|nr:hypothetical protein [Bacteroides sp.]